MANKGTRRTTNSRKRQNKSSGNNNIILYIAIGGVLLALAVVWVIVAQDSKSVALDDVEEVVKEVVKEATVAEGVSIENITVGGMTKAEVIEAVGTIDTSCSGNIVSIKSNDEKYKYTYTYQDFGAAYDMDKAIEAAFAENAKGNISAFSYDRDKIAEKLRAVGQEVDIKPIDAKAERRNGVFVTTTSASKGQEIEESAVVEDIVKLMDNREFDKEVVFEVSVKEPKVIESDFNAINNIIGSFKSPYKNGDENRIGNLRNACAKLDGTVVAPGEVFSTNASFNPCTIENGWFMAGTIVNGKVEDSIGGGMCQVSSALYDAVLYAELEVVERFNHSMKVGYSDYAFDATLAGDYKDFKFRNNTDYPVYIESSLSNNNVVVKLYGYEIHSPSRTLKFENKFIGETQPGEPIVTYDDTMLEGTEKITLTALVGKKYELYKYVYENGQLIDTVKINTSTYLPRRQEITKGSKKAEASTEVQSTATEVESEAASVVTES